MTNRQWLRIELAVAAALLLTAAAVAALAVADFVWGVASIQIR